MAEPRGAWIGRTGLRLALVCVGVAVLSIGIVLAVAAATVAADLSRLEGEQQADISRALALASRDAYSHGGWNRSKLDPVIDLVDRAGAAVQVRGSGGGVVGATPGFAGSAWVSERRETVTEHGRPIGLVTVRFRDAGLEAAVVQFADLRWRIRLAGAAGALLAALAVSLIVSRYVTAPVDRLTRAARAMGAGDTTARVGRVRGVSEVRGLATAFDQMADSLAGEARVRRDMVADIAHELRAPVTVLRAESEALADGVTEPSHENLRSLGAETARLGEMIDDLQELAAADAAGLQVDLATHDLGAVADQVCDGLAESLASADVRLVRRTDQVVAICDARRMHEVAVNLLTNAVKFTPAGGTVTVETGPAGPSGSLAMLRVTDTGIGIPASELPQVAERFFRGQAAADVPGSGLGLAIVGQLVSAQRGRLEIASDPEKGTAVTVTLTCPDRDSPGPV